jgi:hypothetical protein
LTGRHLTDCQRRLYMKLRDTHTPAIAGAKAGFSTATAYLLEKELPRISLRRSYACGQSVSLPESGDGPILLSTSGTARSSPC